MNPTFSFIVPVFTAETFLPTCLDSIRKQTMQDFEAILVDDGSTDRSGLIADEYAHSDPRFKVIHQKNQGTSGATNTAMRHAVGEYVINLDNDDFVSPNLLEDAMRIINDTHPDLIQYLAVFIDSDGHENRRQSFYQDERLFEGHDSLRLCEAAMPGGFNRTHSRKVIRSELARLLPFIGTSKGADTSFLRRLLFHSERIFFSPKHMFYVREISTSESRKPNPKYLYKEWFDRLIVDLDYCISQNTFLHRKTPFFEFADSLDMYQMFAAKAINDGVYDSDYFKSLSKKLKSRGRYIFDKSIKQRSKACLWLNHTKLMAQRLANRIPEGDFIV